MVKQFDRAKILNRAFAQLGKHELILVLDNLKPDFNIGKLFRSAEVFNVREVYIIGTKFFDPKPAMGSFSKVKATFFETFGDCFKNLEALEYNIFALQSGGAQLMHQMTFPLRTALVLGHEEYGLSFKPEEFPSIKSITIQQFGVTESLNVSIAGTLSMYEYMRQNYLQFIP